MLYGLEIAPAVTPRSGCTFHLLESKVKRYFEEKETQGGRAALGLQVNCSLPQEARNSQKEKVELKPT